MSTNEPEQAPPDPSPSSIDFTAPDAVVQLLSMLGQTDPKLELGMTLDCGGIVITGTVIGKARWIEDHATAYEDQLGGVIRTLGEMISPGGEEEIPHDQYGFIHLKDARYVSGGQILPTPGGQGLFWRGRIAAVTGWSFGTIGPSE